jgi:hypothetical protein
MAACMTQADFDAVAAAEAPPARAVASKRKRLAPLPEWLRCSRVLRQLADVVVGRHPPASVLAVVSHVSPTSSIRTKAGNQILLTTFMMNDSTRRNFPLLLWGDTSKLFPGGVEAGDLVALSAVCASEYRGTVQLKPSEYHGCSATVLVKRGVPVADLDGAPSSLKQGVGSLGAWAAQELFYVWEGGAADAPSGTEHAAGGSMAAAAGGGDVAPTSGFADGTPVLVVSNAAALVDWPHTRVLPRLRCWVRDVRESVGADCMYRTAAGGRAMYRRWQATLLPAESPGVGVLCLLWHFAAEAEPVALAAFRSLRDALVQAATTEALIELTSCRITQSAADGCRVLNNTPSTQVLAAARPPPPPLEESLVTSNLGWDAGGATNTAAALSATASSVVGGDMRISGVFASRRSTITGRVVAMAWPHSRVKVCSRHPADRGVLEAMSARCLVPWACTNCSCTAAGRGQSSSMSWAPAAGLPCCVQLDGPSSSTAAAALTCLPSTWPLLSPTPAGLSQLLHLTCPACLGAVENRDEKGVARCSDCANPLAAAAADTSVLGRPAPPPPMWEYAPAFLLLCSDPHRSPQLQPQKAPMWLKVADNDLLTEMFGGIPAELAALAAARHRVLRGGIAPAVAPPYAGSNGGGAGDGRWMVERAAASLAEALSNSTRIEADITLDAPSGPFRETMAPASPPFVSAALMTALREPQVL